MPEQDYVVPGIVLEQYAKFDIKELYTIMHDWLVQRGYDFLEKQYVEEKNDIKAKWDAEKKIDDYTKFVIKISLKISNVQEVETPKRKLKQGDINIKFESYIQRDYEETWEKRPTHKFFRGLFDKYVVKGKFEDYEKKLKEETYHFYEDVKAFLKMPKF